MCDHNITTNAKAWMETIDFSGAQNIHMCTYFVMNSQTAGTGEEFIVL